MAALDKYDAFVDVDEAAAAWAKEHAGELIADLEETTAGRLKDLVSSAFSDGLSPDELSKLIEESYDFSEGRADTIARTELANAQSEGGLEAARRSDVVKRKKSILGSEHDQDDVCNENADAGEIDLDEDFPSGDDASPFHPNCVCDTLFVVDDEEED